MSRLAANLRAGLVYGLLSLAAFLSIFPFFWMLVGTTNTAADIIKGKVSFGSALFENISNLFAQVDMLRVFGNSAFLAVVGTILTLAVSSLAGYAFEMFQSKMRERLFSVLLLILSIPFAAIMVPLFVMMAKLKLINTFTAILLPIIASVFIIFYFRQATKAFPRELRDAAKIDGLKEWQRLCCTNRPEVEFSLRLTESSHALRDGCSERREAVQDRGADMQFCDLAVEVA